MIYLNQQVCCKPRFKLVCACAVRTEGFIEWEIAATYAVGCEPTRLLRESIWSISLSSSIKIAHVILTECALWPAWEIAK